MKAFICSDIHTEFYPEKEHKEILNKFPDTEAIIIAGDLTTKSFLESNIKHLCEKYEHVFYVVGNHEFYGSSFSEIIEILNSISCKNFHWLENNQHANIAGTTLWFQDDPLNQVYEHYLNDFNMIKDLRMLVYNYNNSAKEYLSLCKTDIIVTHHLPLHQSVPEQFKNSHLNRFFVCDMEKVILENKPKIWIHGHTHSSRDYMIGDTRIICNPMGYRHELNKKFSYDKIIEI